MTPDVLKRVRDSIARHAGIYFSDGRLDDLNRRLRQAAREAGAASAQELVEEALAKRSDGSRFDQLISHLTVGETYFFREKTVFDALAQEVFPEALARKRAIGERRLVVWIAGCATGEEAYSVAILMERLLPPDDTLQAVIIASDINPHFLERAAAAGYTSWSFRGVDAPYRDRYFTTDGAGRRVVIEPIRKRVSFVRHNLVTDPPPSALLTAGGIDFIFCRNVLMYFAPETMVGIIRGFASVLNTSGWLIVSQTECSHYFCPPFTSVKRGEAYLYRKMEADEARPAATQEPLPPDWYKAPLASAAQPIGELPPTVSTPPVSPKPPPLTDVETLVEEASRLANQQCYPEAIARCEEAIRRNQLHTDAHYLLATLLEETGRTDEARQALRRTLYLNQD